MPARREGARDDTQGRRSDAAAFLLEPQVLDGASAGQLSNRCAPMA